MKCIQIPHIENHFICKDGDVYYSNNENEAVNIPGRIDKFKKVIINNLEYRVDHLIMITYVGDIDLPIKYKDGIFENCTLDNLTYLVHDVSYEDNNTLYINDSPIIFKRIPESNDFISMNGVVFSASLNRFKNIAHRKNGYCAHQICIAGKSKKMYTHRLVYMAWHQPILQDLVIDHVNGKKWDNHARNLEMVTSSVNNERAFGLSLKSRKWSDFEIAMLCRMMEINYTIDDICNLFGVTESRDKRIMSGLIFSLKNGLIHCRIAKEYDLTKYNNSNHRYTVVTDRDKHIISALLEHGFNPAQIANITELNESTVKSYKKKLINNKIA